MMTTLGAPRFLGTTLLAATALTGAALALPGTSAGDAGCDVTNVRAGTHHTSLQDAVGTAVAGDKLRVAGICVGSTVIDRDLVVTGIRTQAAPRPTLDGGRAGRVLKIESGVTVRLKGLVIRRGEATGDFGGGINNAGALTLKNVVVVANRSDNGGGIYSTGPLVLNGRTIVARNQSVLDDGGGIAINGSTLIVNDATQIRGNEAGRGGGGIYGVLSSMTLNGSSSVRGNRATTGGGGIYVDFDSTLLLNDTTSVHQNLAGEKGGGVFNGNSLTIAGTSSIEDNTASLRGGGIWVGCYAQQTGVDLGGNVRGNHPSNQTRETGCP